MEKNLENIISINKIRRIIKNKFISSIFYGLMIVAQPGCNYIQQNNYIQEKVDYIEEKLCLKYVFKVKGEINKNFKNLPCVQIEIYQDENKQKPLETIRTDFRGRAEISSRKIKPEISYFIKINADGFEPVSFNHTPRCGEIEVFLTDHQYIPKISILD